MRAVPTVLPHGVPGAAGQTVPAFSGAFQLGMCTGAILRAKLSDLRPLPPGGIQPVGTVEPVSWGYRNPFGLRFAPDHHVLDGGLLVSENGEDQRGPRPVLNAPDRLHVVPKKVTRGGLDFHGWPDLFGFLDSTQRLFIPDAGGGDNPAASAGQTVQHLLQVPPQPPIAPIALLAADVAAVGLDFVPKKFEGGGNPGNKVDDGDALVTREGDFGFEPANGNPIEGHDVIRVAFLKNGGISLERFAFNCKSDEPGHRPRRHQALHGAGQSGLRRIHARPCVPRDQPPGGWQVRARRCVLPGGLRYHARRWGVHSGQCRCEPRQRADRADPWDRRHLEDQQEITGKVETIGTITRNKVVLHPHPGEGRPPWPPCPVLAGRDADPALM